MDPTNSSPASNVISIRDTNSRQLATTSSSSSYYKKRPAPTVLEEDDYVEQMSNIIERDFFPDLKKIKVQNGYLAAIEEGDIAKARHLAVEIARIKTGKVNSGASTASSIGGATPLRPGGETPFTPAQPLAGPLPPSAVTDPITTQTITSNLSLDAFQNKYTSEDNASFSKIVESSNDAKRERYKWIYDKDTSNLVLESSAPQLLITNGGSNDATTSSNIGGSNIDIDDTTPSADIKQIASWKQFKARNALMYFPEGFQEIDPAFKSTDRNSTNVKSISHHATRLQPAPSTTSILTNSQERLKTDNLWREMAKATPALFPSVGGSASPQVNGFGYVPSTPLINPADLDDEQLIMTWGEVAATPLLLDSGLEPDDGTHGPRFRMNPTPRRDQLGYDLADKRSKRRGPRGMIDGVGVARPPSSVASSSTSSPRFAKPSIPSNFKVGSGFDSQLRASYSPIVASGARNSKVATPRGGSVTPSLASRVSVTPSPRGVTPMRTSDVKGVGISSSNSNSGGGEKGDSGTGITDNLLNF
ncbi:hypothetical protein SmJEL517_g03131 [Synchytrium microbalum]|uniref:Nuclear protein DGCR14 n=1 Tax=Synchytrium microbalum TaxID=1806994 RepID=A0A507BZC9_9FUNG|nr:uncharacterized protein SmJEL517_g03131 [Synchytrium microbalum]TPX34157.1 hypothetical protein SmJEL517_g03131 [Synchytrium microbalum]